MTTFTYPFHDVRNLASTTSGSHDLVLEILSLVMRHRRLATDAAPCRNRPCPECLAPHYASVARAVALGEPIVFVLPAFPAKSPNPAKVLGPLPDQAEQCSLDFLEGLCARIQRIYAPGARVILCSDGRVFSDVVGMRESDVTAYQDELAAMIARMPGRCLETFNLDDVHAGASFDEMRQRLVEQYGTPLEELRSAIRAGGEPQRLYCGITRFLVEDATRPEATMSRTALQKECRQRAYHVIQRSKAWGDLLARQFPDAVRLSIHPQACGSEKLGIHLMDTDSAWLTPWHGVAVDLGGRFALLKRADAVAMGGRLVSRNGRPSHYVLSDARRSESLLEAAGDAA